MCACVYIKGVCACVRVYKGCVCVCACEGVCMYNKGIGVYKKCFMCGWA